MNHSPRVSVLLPVWNAEKFLGEALDSLAVQTFCDFEVVAVDDGSTDRSGELLRTAAARWPWVRVLSQPNGGIAAALNRAVAASRGGLIFRMDADDVSLPTRIERQVRFLDQHPEIGVCGTAIETFGAGRRRIVRCARHNAEIRARMVFGCPIVHPSVAMRREIIVPESGPYSGTVEDYDLWLRLARRTQFANLPAALLRYRAHSSQYSAVPWEVRREVVWSMQARLLRTLGLCEHELDADAHAACGLVNPAGVDIDLARGERWLVRLRTTVAQSGWTARDVWRRECADAWWRLARRRAAEQCALWKYLRSPLVQFSPRLVSRIGFLLVSALAVRT